MPRTITVTFADGSSHTYQNAPDGISPEEVTARAQNEFNKPVKALDGGRKVSTKPTVDTYQQRWSDLQSSKAQEILGNAQQALLRRYEKATPQARSKALARFHADPRLQAIRKLAGLPSISTRDEEIRAIARSNVDQRRSQMQQFIKERGSSRDLNSQGERNMAAAGASASRALFGLPERASAALRYYTGLSGNAGRDYSETLDIARAENDYEMAQGNTASRLLGTTAGSLVGGGAVGTGVKKLGVNLAARSAPVVRKAGNVLQSLTTLKQGQRTANAARIVGAGAAGGAAQAAGEGSDISTGALYGAGGAATLVGGVKAGAWLGRKASEVLRLSGVNSILRKYTTMTPEALKEAATKFRKETGAEPTVYELLPLEDRQNLQKALRLMPGESREQAANLARQRVQNIPGEVATTAKKATRGQRTAAAKSMATDLARSRGATAPTKEELSLASQATENPTRLAQLQRQEARNIMAPYDDRVAYNSVDELLPASPVQGSQPGQVVYKIDDPEVAKAIQSAASTLKLRKEGGITIKEVTGIIQELKADLDGGLIERSLAQKSIDHLEGLLAQDHPDVLPAIAKMNEQWAGKARQLEGMKGIQLQADAPAKTARQLRLSENIYETPEGATGRMTGQTQTLISDLGAASQPALGTIRELAESPNVAQQLTQNLGTNASRTITQAARTQSKSVMNLAAAVHDTKSNLQQIEPGDLVALLSTFDASAMLRTKLWSINTLSRLAQGIPENRARTLVDMLFSQDKALTQKAINALRTSGDQEKQALRTIIAAITAGSMSGSQDSPQPEIASPDAPVAQDVPADISEEPTADESPYAQDLQAIYDTENPELLDLVDRVINQESGGNQFDANGQPLASSAGAIGIMQIMPETAPEAAAMAGVPWDEEAYYSDPVYNQILGIAYLTEMLRRYNGDVELALAAYNAGPGRADQYAAGQSGLPSETQDYVARIM